LELAPDPSGGQIPPPDSAALEAASAVQSRCAIRPSVGLILGSGLGELADLLEAPCRIPFATLPHHPTTSVAGHAGRLELGYLESMPVAVWRGRLHFYEGHLMPDVAFPIRVAHALGVRAMVLTNAAGGLAPTMRPGDLMLIRDHINLPSLCGHNPLRGELAAGQDRFVDLVGAYDAELRQSTRRVAERLELELREGVYAMVAGPSYETPAEANVLRALGADAVGMSTAPEVVVSRQLGLRVLAISTITNVLGDASLSHQQVLAAAEAAKPRFSALIRGILKEMREAP
jgi:purine-nucleoside phosphorylase